MTGRRMFDEWPLQRHKQTRTGYEQSNKKNLEGLICLVEYLKREINSSNGSRTKAV